MCQLAEKYLNKCQNISPNIRQKKHFFTSDSFFLKSFYFYQYRKFYHFIKVCNFILFKNMYIETD